MASVLTRQAFSTVRALGRRDIRPQSRLISTSQRSNMKLVQFSYVSEPLKPRVGFVVMAGVRPMLVDLNKLDPGLPDTVIEIMKRGLLDKVISLESKNDELIDLSVVRLRAPVTGMDKVLCVGLNYLDHCKEQNKEPPKVPMIFSKFASCVVGPEDNVMLRTDVTKCVDYEVELVVVIGREASRVKASEAFAYVAGYTISQDISARDWQKDRNAGQFLLGKSMDTFCPIGPYLLTSDEVKDPQNLDIRCTINGVIKQKSNTEQLVHKIPDVIERLSNVMTLYPGDIILTGTPGGVGMYRDPPEYLKPGDVIESQIECLGTLTTKVTEF